MLNTGAYLELSQTCIMELFYQIINSSQKSSIIDISQLSKYVPGKYSKSIMNAPEQSQLISFSDLI